MKKFKDIIGCALILCGFIGIIACAIAALVFRFQNPDMTEMRLFYSILSPQCGVL